MHRIFAAISLLFFAIGGVCLSQAHTTNVPIKFKLNNLTPYAKLAQLQMMGVGTAAGGGGGSSYTGPSDVTSGNWSEFYSLQAINNSYAAGSGKFANGCLPSSSSCFDIVSNASGQAVIPAGLSTCNNSTVICTLDIVYTQSGLLNCGGTACNMTRFPGNTQANDPILVVAGVGNGCPNTSQPCMGFVAGTTGLRSGNATNYTIAQPYTTWGIAIRTGNTGTAGSVLGDFTTAGFIFGFGGTNGNIRCNYGSSAFEVAGFTEGTWGTMQGIANGASSTLRANGGSATTGNCGTGAYSSDLIYLGSEVNNTGPNDLTGKIAETGIMTGDQSSFAAALNTNARSIGRWNF